jgi:hypothetical protein
VHPTYRAADHARSHVGALRRVQHPLVEARHRSRPYLFIEVQVLLDQLGRDAIIRARAYEEFLGQVVSDPVEVWLVHIGLATDLAQGGLPVGVREHFE